MDKKDFWQSLKEFMFKTSKEENINIMDYYITMKQNEKDMLFLIEDCNKYESTFYYDSSSDSYNDDGSIVICFQKSNENNWIDEYLNYSYKINLLSGDCYDWFRPKIAINKTEWLSQFTFDGNKNDMIKLQSEFENNLKELEISRKREELFDIVKQINCLEEQKNQIEQLLSELEETNV